MLFRSDLPWNPNRLEQRFGRIHRIGQTEVCHLWNLVSKETREGMVFQRLFEKLEQEREALKGKVFDILGKVSFDNRSLRDIIIEAVRYGNDPAVRARLYEVVDHSLDRGALEKLLDEHALTGDAMDIGQVMAIREDMERKEAQKLQPYFIEAFFLEAFQSVGGKIKAREKGRYEILSVPFAVRNRVMQIGFGEPVLQRYERVCFDKPFCSLQGLVPAALIAPGHPLLEATIDLVRERHADVLKRGAVFIDDDELSADARLLFYVEDSVQDGVILPSGGKRVISKHMHFVEIRGDGTATNAGYAPYLNYRAPKDGEREAVRAFLESHPWLQTNVEEVAVGYAISRVIPAHVSEARKRKIGKIDKTTKAVKERLTSEIRYWDFRVSYLKTKEAAGKSNAKVNSQMAARRAEELASRLQKRLAELETERQISAMPPVVVGGAIVIPRGMLLAHAAGALGAFCADAEARRRIELIAMQTVLDIERSLGYEPKDVSMTQCHYDVESRIPPPVRDKDGATLRFIEVKGRAVGANTVTVHKNEILTALNKPNEFLLAIVEVDGERTRTIYLKKPFQAPPDFAATSVIYNIAKLTGNAETVLTREQGHGIQEEVD